MIKTFTCREMGGICDKEMSGEKAEEVAKLGWEHIETATDQAHMDFKAKIGEMPQEKKDEWMVGFTKQFDEKE